MDVSLEGADLEGDMAGSRGAADIAGAAPGGAAAAAAHRQDAALWRPLLHPRPHPHRLLLHGLPVPPWALQCLKTCLSKKETHILHKLTACSNP